MSFQESSCAHRLRSAVLFRLPLFLSFFFSCCAPSLAAYRIMRTRTGSRGRLCGSLVYTCAWMWCNAHTRPAGSYCPLVTPSERTCTRLPQNWAHYNYFRALYSTRTAAWAAFLMRPRVKIPTVLNGEGTRHLNAFLQCF